MIILITGGASGLGEAITRKVARNRTYEIYFTYVHSVKLAKQIEADYPNVRGIKCDFKDKNEVKQLTDKIKRLNVDVLINNAYTGDFINSYYHKTSPNDFQNAFIDNIIPTIKITQAAINIFRKKKFGKIITILTAALVNTPPIGSSVYAANKAYLRQLSKVWAGENAKFNITSNTVSPAFMATGFTKAIDERVVDQIITNHPLKKLLTTEEVAESVSFLVNSSQQINGIDLLLNSGINIR